MKKEQLIEDVKKNWDKLNKQSISSYNSEIKNIDLVKHVADFFSAGLYYYFILNFNDYSVEKLGGSFNEIYGYNFKKLTFENMMLCYTEEDIIDMQDKEKNICNFLFNYLTKEEIYNYKVCYLVKTTTANGQNKIILHQSKTIELSPEGKILKTLVVHTDITHLNPKLDNKISFISKNKSFYSYGFNEYLVLYQDYNLTKKEIEIIENIANGKSEIDISEELNITIHTVKSHKKNIFRKTKVKNSAELVAKCLRENIINY